MNDSMNLLTTIVIILIAFTIGYKVIGWLFDRLKGVRQSTGPATESSENAGPQWEPSLQPGEGSGSRAPIEGGNTRTYEDPETRYARVLGLPRSFTAREIQERYQTLIASYHPDKVSHLGPELREMAARTTREIVEAYEYFRVKYNLKQ
jgi:hypothetical protein